MALKSLNIILFRVSKEKNKKTFHPASGIALKSVKIILFRVSQQKKKKNKR